MPEAVMDIKQSSTRIAYVDPLGVLPEFRRELVSHFPLQNLHWSSGDRPLRTIPSLDVSLEPLDTTVPQHQVMGLSDSPLIQLFFVEAENVDVYRGKVRKQAQEFRKQVEHLRDPTGWLVVHYVGKGGKKRSKAVWQKLTADFDARAVQLYLDSGTDNEEWAKFVAILKQEILTAFSARVNAYENEIRKLQSTRDIVGWNFGTLFAMKESLAWSFEKMNFLDDAYQIYTELERMAEPSFFQPNASEESLTASVLQPNRERITELMLQQQASFLDFSLYLFAREILILLYISQTSTTTSTSLADKHLVRAVYRAFESIPRLVNLILTEKFSKERAMLWQMKTAREISEISQDFGSATSADGRGELVLLQTDALQVLASSLGYKIPGVLSDVSLTANESNLGPKGHARSATVTAAGSLNWLESEDKYQEQFIVLTKQAMEFFKQTKNQRSLNRLQVQLASIAYSRSEYKEALLLIGVLPKVYGELGWFTNSIRLHHMAIQCAKNLNLPSRVLDLSWSLLHYQQHLTPQQSQRCIDEITELAGLEEMHNLVETWYNLTLERWIAGETSYFIQIKLKPRFPGSKGLKFDEGEIAAEVVSAGGPSKQPIIFRCTDFSEDSSGYLRFYTKHFYEGNLNVKTLKLKLKKQILVKQFGEDEVLLRMVPLKSCFHAQLSLAQSFSLTRRNLVLKINSPVPTDASVKILPVDGLQILHDKLTTTGLEKFTESEVSVPALTSVEAPRPSVVVTIEYSEGGRYEFVRQLDMSLAVIVQVQEHFQEGAIIEQFLVSSTTSDPIILESAELTSRTNVEIQELSVPHRPIAFDGSPVSLLYSLTGARPRDRLAPEMSLVVSHRLASSECTGVLWHRIVNALKASDSELLQYELLIRSALAKLTVDTISWVIQRSFVVDLAELSAALWEELDGINPAHINEITERAHEVLGSAVTGNEVESLSQDDLHSLDLSLDVTVPWPEVDVLHVIDCELQAFPQYVVGQPIVAEFSVDSVTSWSAKDSAELSKLVFEYEIDKETEDWSLAGAFRGRFSGNLKLSVTLVPQKAGKLRLPTLHVTSLAPRTMFETNWLYRAERIIVKPEINRLAITF